MTGALLNFGARSAFSIGFVLRAELMGPFGGEASVGFLGTLSIELGFATSV